MWYHSYSNGRDIIFQQKSSAADCHDVQTFYQSISGIYWSQHIEDWRISISNDIFELYI